MQYSNNPFTNQINNKYRELNIEEINEKIDSAHKAYNVWKKKELSQRVKVITQISNILNANISNYAKFITDEMGKPIKESIAEINKCISLCSYYIEHCDHFLSTDTVIDKTQVAYVSYRPIGIILGVMPWNFPFWQVFRFAIPTILSGNVVLVKHASLVPKCSILIGQLFNLASENQSIYTNLLINKSNVKNVLDHSKVRAVSLTGSEQAGKSVAINAAANIKKSILELGGNDAYLILEDADIDLAIECCISSRLINGGQSCIGAKRIIVVESIHDMFVRKLKMKLSSIKFDDPKNMDTKLGPLASNELRDTLHEQVQESIKLGALLELGGEIPNTIGSFYPVTLLTNIKKNMPAYDEELFGPVWSIITCETEIDGINISNDSNFGLGAAVFTQNIKKGQYIAEFELEAGSCAVNNFVKSDPKLPFGGINNSGYGRELGLQGIRAFINEKTITIKNG